MTAVPRVRSSAAQRIRAMGAAATGWLALLGSSSCDPAEPRQPVTGPSSTAERTIDRWVDRPSTVGYAGPLERWRAPPPIRVEIPGREFAAGGALRDLPWPVGDPASLQVDVAGRRLELADPFADARSASGFVLLPRRRVVPCALVDDKRGRTSRDAVASSAQLRLRHGDWFGLPFLTVGDEQRVVLRMQALGDVRAHLEVDGVERRTYGFDGSPGWRDQELELDLEPGVHRMRWTVFDPTRDVDDRPGEPLLLVDTLTWENAGGDRLWTWGDGAGATCTVGYRARMPGVVESMSIGSQQGSAQSSLLALGGEVSVGWDCETAVELSVGARRLSLSAGSGTQDLGALEPGLHALSADAEVALEFHQPSAPWIARWSDPDVFAADDLARHPDSSSALYRSLGRFDLGDDRRLGFVLPGGSSLTAPLPAAEGGRRLRFSLGADRFSDGAFEVLVRLDDRVIQRFDVGSGDGWQDFELELPATERAALGFDVSGRDLDGVVVLGDPRVLPRSAPRTQPNLLLYLVDTLRADHLHCYGAERPTSPHFDRLAADSYRFADLRAVASWTRPTVATVFSGVLPTHHGILHDKAALPFELVTLAERLRAGGWTNWAAIANIQVSAAGVHFEQGFHRFVAPEGVGVPSPKLQIEPSSKALDRFVEKYLPTLADEPFFLYLHSMDPHFPYRPPEETRGEFSADYEGPLTERHLVLLPELWQMHQPDRPLGEHDLEHLRKVYDEEILAQDRELGRLLERLDQQGLRDDTVIVVMSDHGEEFSEHGGLTHAGRMWEELLHVPLSIHVPQKWRAQLGLREPGVVEAPVSQLDVFATLIELLGVEHDLAQHGRSLLDHLRADVEPPTEGTVYCREALDLGCWVEGSSKLLFEPQKLLWRGPDDKLRPVADGTGSPCTGSRGAHLPAVRSGA